MKPILLLAVLATLLAPAASAATVGPFMDLPLAALVGQHDPRLPAAERRDLTALANGERIARHADIPVTASAITCRESDVAIGERSCELLYDARTVTLTGLKAHEMDATLKEAGARSEGAAGTLLTGLTDLKCSVSPLQILAKAGGGASCTFTPAK